MAAEDEARAAAWRAEQERIASGRRAIDAKLSRGNAAAYALFRAGWEPLERWLQERRNRDPLPEEPEVRGN